MKTSLLFCLLLGALLAGCRRSDPMREKQTGRIIRLTDSLFTATPARDTIDLGRMHEGEVVQQYLRLENATRHAVAVTRIETSCGCTAVEVSEAPLSPGAQVPVTIRFDSRGFKGWQWKTVEIHTTLAQRPLKIFLQARVE